MNDFCFHKRKLKEKNFSIRKTIFFCENRRFGKADSCLLYIQMYIIDAQKNTSQTIVVCYFQEFFFSKQIHVLNVFNLKFLNFVILIFSSKFSNTVLNSDFRLQFIIYNSKLKNK